jgi:hypothetical protein
MLSRMFSLLEPDPVKISIRLGYARQVDPFPRRDLQDLLVPKRYEFSRT